ARVGVAAAQRRQLVRDRAAVGAGLLRHVRDRVEALAARVRRVRRARHEPGDRLSHPHVHPDHRHRRRIRAAARRVRARHDVDTGPTERNLAWRAALAYADATGWPNGFAIEIEKRLPVGGGLGGGSADAGAVLRCLNALAPSPLGVSALLSIAAPLGADVPFL